MVLAYLAWWQGLTRAILVRVCPAVKGSAARSLVARPRIVRGRVAARCTVPSQSVGSA